MPKVSTVADVMALVRNYYQTVRVNGDFTVKDGKLDYAFDPGSWLAVTGAGTHAGVYQLDDSGCLTGLPDMTFTGTVWLLEPPESFLRLCGEIEAWTAEHPGSGVKSETLGAYSCTFGDIGGRPLGWQQVFADGLREHRRMWTEVRL